MKVTPGSMARLINATACLRSLIWPTATVPRPRMGTRTLVRPKVRCGKRGVGVPAHESSVLPNNRAPAPAPRKARRDTVIFSDMETSVSSNSYQPGLSNIDAEMEAYSVLASQTQQPLHFFEVIEKTLG